MNENQPPRYCLFGAGPGTGNLGVCALRLALLGAIARRAPDAHVTVFDDRGGHGPVSTRLDRRDFAHHRCGAIPTRRLHRPDSLWRIRLAGRIGGGGHPAIRALRHADAVIDVSGGDSFTDLYGRRRFRAITLPKIIVLEQGAPLVLAPQTIGPFRSGRSIRAARDILDAADLVFTRDAGSLDTVRRLLGARFDPARHRAGVDVAFGLASRAPVRPMPEPIRSWLFSETDRPLIALNISGLLFNRPTIAARQFGLRADYRRTIFAIVRRLLHDTDANIMLVPHVITRSGHHENDVDAMTRVKESIHSPDRPRVAIVPPGYDAAETKWLIGRADWGCGTRMHATIAALGSGVPCAALAYSDKTRGVFETCGLEDQVADPRTEDDDAIVEHVFRSWCERDEAAARLARRLPAVRNAAETQMEAILAPSADATRPPESILPKAA